MAKKRTWEQNEQKVTSKKPCWRKCECAKVVISKESLENWRIPRNELLKELEEAKEVLKMKENKINELEAKYLEQDNIIKDMFDDMVESSDKMYWYKLWRNISIAFNIILVVLLALFII